MMKYFLLFLCFVCFFRTEAQITELSDKAEISLITCGPGTELYAAFGHTAFRIRDPLLKIDRVYNYGTFDFEDPNFYPNFAKGHLEYFLSAYDFGRFARTYHAEKRWVKAQVLDLNHSDVQLIFEFLEQNALPENRIYLYDYFFDNCSTKPIDVINATIGEKLVRPNLFKEDSISHRAIIQPYLEHLSWGDFGIDLALGSVIDRNMTPQEYLFLPENVFLYVDALKIVENGEEKSLIKRTETVLDDQFPVKKDSFFSPFIVFSILALICMLITFRDLKRNRRSRFFDFGLFFITGLIGVFILLIWLATNHISAKNNFNVLWAFAPNIVVSFYLIKQRIPKWISSYALLNLIVLAILIVLWITKIQVFSIAILPILCLLAIRYFYLWKIAK